jgi:predicted metal-dependent hydrolase
MEVVVKMMVTVVDIGMIMVVVITLVLFKQVAMILAKGMKWLVKVMLQVEIMVLNMVVEHIIIDYLGHKHCLLVLFMDLSKR